MPIWSEPVSPSSYAWIPVSLFFFFLPHLPTEPSHWKCARPQYDSEVLCNSSVMMRAVRLQHVTGHELLIFTHCYIYLIICGWDFFSSSPSCNCVTRCAHWRVLRCVSTVCLCVCTRARACKSATAWACVDPCVAPASARTHARTLKAPTYVCVCVFIKRGRRGEAELSYLKWFLLSDCSATQLSARPSSVCAGVCAASPLLFFWGWMMDYDRPDGWWSATLAPTKSEDCQRACRCEVRAVPLLLPPPKKPRWATGGTVALHVSSGHLTGPRLTGSVGVTSGQRLINAHMVF